MHSSQQGDLRWSDVLLWSPCPFLWKTLVSLCYLLFFPPISARVLSVTCVPHIHQDMGQKLAVSTFPTQGWNQHVAFNCGRKPKETTKKHKGTIISKIGSRWLSHGPGILWFPLVSFGFFRFPLASFRLGLGGFYGFPLVSFVFLFFSCGFLWFPSKSKNQISQGKWRLEKAAPDGNASIMTVTLW